MTTAVDVMDVICPVRPGDDNDELRFALRTWEQHLPHARIWIVGDKPSWVTNVEFIPGNTGPTGHANVYRNILAACEHPDISPTAVVLNDDIYVTEPVDTPPTWFRSTLREHLELPRVKKAKGQWWPTSLETTLICLQAHGIADPISYELHTPFVIDTQKMADTLRLFQHVTPDNPPQWRSLYGSMHSIGGTRHHDGKMYGPGDIHTPYHSTEDRSWHHFAARFAHDYPTPSRYERQ
ncbi:hypothetical protein [Gordonia tangerina]|uniref:hypothetical protein n=1 Tax=Gordonia tangerina TaxID=2911060 RepID=UPI003EE23222